MRKTGKFKDLSINTILFTISNFGSRLVSFLLVPLYTYVLSTEEYGNIDLVTTTVFLLVPILTVNVQDAVLRFALDKDNDPREVISVGIRMTWISSLILGAGLSVVSYFGLLSFEKKYTYFLFLSFVITSLNNILSMYMKAQNKVRIMVVFGIISTLLTCVLNIYLLLWVKMGVTGYLVANVVGHVAAVIGMMYFGKVHKDFSLRVNRKLQHDMLVYSAPLIANSLAWWINTASDRYILTFFCGVAVNGIYAVSYKIPTILSTLQSIIYNAWSISAITEFDENDSDGFIGNVYSIYSCFSFISCSVIMLLNIWIAKVLYANSFFEAWKYVPPLLVGTVFNGISLFEGCIFTAVKKTKDVSKTTIIGAIVNTFCNIILIYSIGAIGAAIATLMGYFVIWVARSVKLRNIIKMRVNWKIQIISIIFMFLQMLLALAGRFVICQLICLIGILICQRKLIKKVATHVIKKTANIFSIRLVDL